MELKVNNFTNLSNLEKLNNSNSTNQLEIEKEQTSIEINDNYKLTNINKGSAIPQYNLNLSNNPDEIKENLSEISKAIKAELKNFFGTENLKDIQNIVGAEQTNELDNQTIDKISTFINADDFIKSQIDNMIKYREFEAMINLFKIQMKILDKALQTIK